MSKTVGIDNESGIFSRWPLDCSSHVVLRGRIFAVRNTCFGGSELHGLAQTADRWTWAQQWWYLGRGCKLSTTTGLIDPATLPEASAESQAVLMLAFLLKAGEFQAEIVDLLAAPISVTVIDLTRKWTPERERQRERDRDRDRQIDRERERVTERERDKEREREGGVWKLTFNLD